MPLEARLSKSRPLPTHFVARPGVHPVAFKLDAAIDPLQKRDQATVRGCERRGVLLILRGSEDLPEFVELVPLPLSALVGRWTTPLVGTPYELGIPLFSRTLAFASWHRDGLH